MSTFQTKVGPIAFLDILGYKSFIVRNSPESSAEIIKSILDGLDEKTKSRIAEAVGTNDPTQNGFLHFKANFQTLLISDSIIGHMPIDSSLDTDTKIYAWAYFFCAIMIIQEMMFTSGLPVRGAVAYGNYVSEKSLIVGRPLIEAYEKSLEIDAAIVTLAKSVEDNLRNSIDGNSTFLEMLNTIVITEYLTPLKGESEERCYTLSWIEHLTPAAKNLDDIRQIVYRAFWGHSKEISREVDQKVFNTEKYFAKHFIDQQIKANKTSKEKSKQL